MPVASTRKPGAKKKPPAALGRACNRH